MFLVKDLPTVDESVSDETTFKKLPATPPPRTTLFGEAASRALAKLVRETPLAFAAELLPALSARDRGPQSNLTLIVAAILLCSPRGTPAPDMKSFADEVGVTSKIAPVLRAVVQHWNTREDHRDHQVEIRQVEQVYGLYFAIQQAQQAQSASASIIPASSDSSRHDDIADLTARFKDVFSRVRLTEAKTANLHARLEGCEAKLAPGKPAKRR